MKFVKAALSALLLTLAMAGTNAAQAADAPASEASIRELLQVMRMDQMGKDMVARIKENLDKRYTQTVAMNGFNADEAKVLREATDKMVAVLEDELSWKKMSPLYVEIYRKSSLTQRDMDAATAFYKTDEGQHIIAQLPLLMQNVEVATQERLAVIKPRLIKIQEEAKKKMDALHSKKK